MEYLITYYSPNAHARKLAHAFQDILPRECTRIVDFEMEQPGNREDVFLVGFELEGHQRTIPLPIIEYLETLEGKTVFLFATSPYQPKEPVLGQLNRAAVSFLPSQCDYRGMYLCPAQPSEDFLCDLRSRLVTNPENSRVKYWLKDCEKSIGHPDQTDLEKGCEFARHVLQLKP